MPASSLTSPARPRSSAAVHGGAFHILAPLVRALLRGIVGAPTPKPRHRHLISSDQGSLTMKAKIKASATTPGESPSRLIDPEN